MSGSRTQGHGYGINTAATADIIDYLIDVDTLERSVGVEFTDGARGSLRAAIEAYWDDLSFAVQSVPSNDVWNQLDLIRDTALSLCTSLSVRGKTGEAALSWLEMENHRTGTRVDIMGLRNSLRLLGRLAAEASEHFPMSAGGKDRDPGWDALILALGRVLEMIGVSTRGPRMVRLAQASLEEIRRLARQLYDPPSNPMQESLLRSLTGRSTEYTSVERAVQRARLDHQ